MKRNVGYDMRRAEALFFNACDGTNILHLIEVFARNGEDVTRQIGDVPDAGELWIVDEDGYNEICSTTEWQFEGRESVGFDRAELEAMENDPS